MPGFNSPATDWWDEQQRAIAWRLRALAAQQQYTCSDAQGRPVLNLGLIPGSNPAEYGLQVLDPTTGNQRIQIGQLSNGDYGVAIFSPANDGTFVELSTLGFGLASNEVVTFEGTSSAGTWVDLTTTGPSVTVTVGTSGRALVTASALMFPGMSGSTSDTTFIGLSIDGSTPGNGIAQFTGASGTGVSSPGSGTISGQTLVTGLSAGSHTFKLKYTTLNGTLCNFENRVITVQPF